MSIQLDQIPSLLSSKTLGHTKPLMHRGKSYQQEVQRGLIQQRHYSSAVHVQDLGLLEGVYSIAALGAPMHREWNRVGESIAMYISPALPIKS